MSTTFDEDDHTRRNRDAICANAIAAALSERFGFVRLSTRYGAAHDAIEAARADSEPMQRREIEWERRERAGIPVIDHDPALREAT